MNSCHEGNPGSQRRVEQRIVYFCSWGGVRLSPLGTLAINWPIVPKDCVREWAKYHQHHHHHWQNSSFWIIAFLRRFCQIASGFQFFGFSKSHFFFTEQGLQPCVQPTTWSICIYILRWQGGPLILPVTKLPFRHFLRLAGLQEMQSNRPPHEENHTHAKHALGPVLN
jgi:hypothetical protein